ncbi:hypothetical protein ABT354_12860 [Streptomyces sp. NPDC000594]|uniref:hypothetical protein n=1 Tax=Streptomyces sp. NPDC000594 TaxID=3154261 RepID=UPI00331FF1E3
MTVVRRGGWSWGEDPQALVDRVIDALPELLAEHFAEVLAGDGPDVEVTGPLTVTVRAARHPAAGGPGQPVEISFGSAEPAVVPVGPGPADGPGAPAWEPSGAVDRPGSPPVAGALFEELAARGEAGALLALLPDDTLRLWLRALLPGGRAGEPVGAVLAELARRGPAVPSAAPTEPAAGAPDAAGTGRGGGGAPAEATAFAGALAAGDTDGAARALAAVLAGPGAAAGVPLLRGAVGRLGAEESVRLCSALTAVAEPGALTVLADLLGSGSGTAAEAAGPVAPQDRGAPGEPDAPGHPAPPARPVPRTPGPPAARTGGEAAVRSVLPYLLVGPLARIGYLDAVGPALAAAELEAEAPLFAMALAYKVLGPTARGWRREPGDRETAAVFAGLAAPPPEEELTDFARRARPVLPTLDAVLALAVCRGHDPADPLLLAGAGGGLLLVDAQGLFPIAWSARAAGLLPHWRACGAPPLLVCGEPPAPGELGTLVAAGVRTLTSIRPLRGDPLVRIPGRTPLWASPGPPPDPSLRRALPGYGERLVELVGALVTERLAVPLEARGELERTVTLAAALGLATLAWTLWREREVPDPVSALTRFADLDASVRFGPDTVRVRIPLGARHADLLRRGLLADVRDVPWLGGRTLTFSGG